MLERAIISTITCTGQEDVYRVEGVTPVRLFTALAEAQVNVDTIVISGGCVVYSAPPKDRPVSKRALKTLGVAWSRLDSLSRVVITGAGIKSHPEIAAQVFVVLAELHICPELISTSPIQIACHVVAQDTQRALQALRATFELENPLGVSYE